MNTDVVKLIAIFIFLLICKIGKSQLTLENIFLNAKYKLNKINDVCLLNKSPRYAKLGATNNGNNILIFDSSNTKVDSIMISEIAIKNNIFRTNYESFIISNTDCYFLIQTSTEHINRNSSVSKNYIIDKDKKMVALSTDKQILPSFSPDDKKIAFIKSNNIFYKDLQTDKEIQVTTDGKWNQIINGKPDWVYEEEFQVTQLYEWNAKSDKIAYLKFDESNVKEYTIPLYYDLVYPSSFSYKYPKVGEENSKISLWYFDLKKKKNNKINIPFNVEYIPRIYWKNNAYELVYMLLNRQQNELLLISYDIKSKANKLLYKETSESYIEIPKKIYFLLDNSFILSSEKDGFRHMYHYDKNGILIHQLTRGNFELLDIYGVDELSHKIYFSTNQENEIENQIYSINYLTLEQSKITTENGNHNAVFSKDFTCFLHTFSSSTNPTTLKLQNVASKKTVSIIDNKNIADSLAKIAKKEFLKIPIANKLLNAWIIKPAIFDTQKKYPLLLFVYGGPAHNEVENSWQSNSDLFFNFLADNGFVVACLDNHGSGQKGALFKKSVYLNLGKKETEDQISFAKYLGTQLYIDANRIGIFGWSYGGFLAANCLFEGNDIFKTAIAIAPISDWKLYDNIYTERYMQTPNTNSTGYNNFNPLVLANKMKGNLFLAHGMADDNVHFQHTISLINALNDAHKNYQLYIYPDAAHSINAQQNRYDLYKKVYEFLKYKL